MTKQQPTSPLSLSDTQYLAVVRATEPLEPQRRSAFLSALAQLLRSDDADRFNSGPTDATGSTVTQLYGYTNENHPSRALGRAHHGAGDGQAPEGEGRRPARRAGMTKSCRRADAS
jgi:hypothetical protein